MKELDNETGLYYYGMRYHASWLGKFISPDPKFHNYPHLTPYNYVANNPLNNIDTDGMDILIWYQKTTEVKDWTGTVIMGYETEEASWSFDGTNASEAPDNEFIQNFISAYEYNISNGGGDNTKKAAFSETTFELRKGNRSRSIPAEYGKNEIVEWNPEGGLRTYNEQGNWIVLSPATVLEHEFDHTIWRDEVGINNVDHSYKDDFYGSWEEYRVISGIGKDEVGSELKTGLANNEIPNGQTSSMYYAASYRYSVVTKSTISNEIDIPKTKEHVKWLKSQGYKIDHYPAKYK